MNSSLPPSTAKEWFEKNHERLGYLLSRWQDEHEYEDRADYKKAIVGWLPAGFKLTKFCLSTAFLAFSFTANKEHFSVKVTDKTVAMTQP